jgi:hypothetical protein
MFSPIESHYFFELLSSVFHAASVAPVVVQYMVQIHSILALVNLDWGVAVVPESASRMQFDNVVYRPLTIAQPAQVELDLVWRLNDENPVLERLLPALGPEGGPHATSSPEMVNISTAGTRSSAADRCVSLKAPPPRREHWSLELESCPLVKAGFGSRHAWRIVSVK